MSSASFERPALPDSRSRSPPFSNLRRVLIIFAFFRRIMNDILNGRGEYAPAAPPPGAGGADFGSMMKSMMGNIPGLGGLGGGSGGGGMPSMEDMQKMMQQMGMGGAGGPGGGAGGLGGGMPGETTISFSSQYQHC